MAVTFAPRFWSHRRSSDSETAVACRGWEGTIRGGGDPDALLDEVEASQLAAIVALGMVSGEIEYQVA